MPARSGPVDLAQHIRRAPYFRALDEATVVELARSAVCSHYAPGEVVFLEGEESLGLYYLEAGWLKVVRASVDGREQVLAFLEPGEIFNAIAAFTRLPNPATAIALEPAAVWLLRRETVGRLLEERPEFAGRVIADMAQRLVALVDLVEDLSLRSVTARLARLVLEGAPEGVLHRPRWYTQAELAARLGTVPDVIQRALSSLAVQGIIQVERQLIRILDRGRLEEIAAGKGA